MKEAIKSKLNYAGTSKGKKKDFPLQNAFNKILKFLSRMTRHLPIIRIGVCSAGSP
jgi:hypothetical protein